MAVRHVMLLRHGQTASSAAGHFTGRADVPLTDVGRAQAAAWRPFMEGLADLTAFSSPLSRAMETATLAGLSPEPMADLAEWDLGPLDGLVADEFRRAHPEWNLYVDGPGEPGETPDAVAARAQRVLARVRDTDSEVVVLVSHGQFLRVLTAAAVDVPLTVGSRFSFGPARSGLLTLRANGRLSLTGWNLPSTVGPDLFDALT